MEKNYAKNGIERFNGLLEQSADGGVALAAQYARCASDGFICTSIAR